MPGLAVRVWILHCSPRVRAWRIARRGSILPGDRTPAMSLVDVSGLRKTYGGVAVVDDLSFCVEKGEIFGLLGPNGAGKTTAMMILAGLRDPDAGTITIGGAPRGRRPRNGRLGLVPQELAIYPELTGRENLQFFAAIYSLRSDRLRKRVDDVLDLIGLREHS